MGLLQEGYIAVRLRNFLVKRRNPGQRGYVRGTDAPHLVMHDIARSCIDCGRCVWMLMGDFRCAFPATWRHDLLTLVAEAGVQDGMFVILVS